MLIVKVQVYPEIELWIIHTPYFEKRNIHFYINRLGFHAVEFIHNRNRPKKNPDEFLGPEEFFKFEKRIKKKGVIYLISFLIDSIEI